MLESNRCDIIYPTASAARPRTSHVLNFHHFLLTLLCSRKLFSVLFTQQLKRQHSSHSSWRGNTLHTAVGEATPLFTQQLERQHLCWHPSLWPYQEETWTKKHKKCSKIHDSSISILPRRIKENKKIYSFCFNILPIRISRHKNPSFSCCSASYSKGSAETQNSIFLLLITLSKRISRQTKPRMIT